ncbi:hypothetical protein JCM4814A_93440 [Streptomyces phaeofaciens JCM 4814]|uniref:Uncharacterized protein n=1 Tax=Streptomyces phaeofaciens TaxID=68254 RepID=A0A918LYR4_9ACTN|nr:hypothetical protein GCM10010226_56780 [Streptomyces phaeofaciens]
MAATDRSHDEWDRQVAEAAARYGRTGDERRTVERQQDAGVAFPDSEEALAECGPAAGPSGGSRLHGGGGGPGGTAGGDRRE